MKPRRALPRLAAGMGVAATLAATFALYLRPDVVVAVADRVWSCF